MNIKKLFGKAVFLTLFMAVLYFNTLAVSASGAPAGDGTETSPYQIKTVDDLYWFANEVNSGNNTICAKLMKDIVVNENLLDEKLTLDEYGQIIQKADGIKTWIPIGNDVIKYEGVFTGGRNSISGLFYEAEENSYVGLFGAVGQAGNVKSLYLKDSYIIGSDYVGGICGDNAGSIAMSYSYGTVVGMIWPDAHTGGVCGNNSGVVQNSYNYGKVFGYYQVGGVCGVNTGTISLCYNNLSVVSGLGSVGGVCGVNEGSITYGYHNGGSYVKFMGDEDSMGDAIGGVCGLNRGVIADSSSLGTVTVTTGDTSWIGGVCGSNAGQIIDCENTGTVNGTWYVGGICGSAGSSTGFSIINCSNEGKVIASGGSVGGICGDIFPNGEIINCNNTGKVSGTNYVGAIYGSQYMAKEFAAENCYYLEGSAKDSSGTIQNGTGASYEGRTNADVEGCTIGKTAEEYKSGEVTVLLSKYVSENPELDLYVWGQIIGKEDTTNLRSNYPVYCVTNCIGGSYSNSSVAGEHYCDRTGTCNLCGVVDEIDEITFRTREIIISEYAESGYLYFTLEPGYYQAKLNISNSDETVVKTYKTIMSMISSYYITMTPISDGTTVVTLSTEDGRVSTTCTVTVDMSVYNGIDYSAVFDYAYYASKYPDIVGDMGSVAAIKYFVQTGMSLGHQASAEFNPDIYKSNYSDLANLYGDDYESYYMHYINAGKAEGRNGATLIEGSDGVVDFVNRMYSIILDREPDAGSETWVNLLMDGTYTGAQVAEGFIMSNEFLNKNISNEEFVKIMYRAFFGREADEGGLATWKGSLDEGYIKKFVFAGFANSDEFKALCDTYGIECGVINLTLAEKTPNLSEQDFNIWQFVERLYSEVMGRNPDQTGMDTWVGVLKNGTYTGAQVAEGFILSNEFLNKNMTNEEFVKIMYRAFFNRDADTDGFKTWTEALETGWTKEAVFAGFANSDEFGRICDEYGIIQGSVTSE